MTTSKETQNRKTRRARTVEFFSDSSVSQYNAFKWGGLILFSSVLGMLALAGLVNTAPIITGPDYSAAGTVALAGIGAPLSLVEIIDADGNRIDTTTVGPTGNWATLSQFEAGEHELHARAISRSREASNPNYPLVLAEIPDSGSSLIAYDLSDYAVSVPSEDMAPGLLTLAGVGAAGTAVKLFANGVEIGETTVGSDGNWSFDADLPDAGDYEINAEAYAPGGVLLGQFPSQKLNVMAPAPESVPLSADGRVAAGIFTTNDGETASGPVSWSGTGTPGSTLELWANGKKIGETFVNPAGEWLFGDVGMDLKIANNLLTVKMLDANGNELGDAVSDTLFLRADSVADNSVPESSVADAPLAADSVPSAGEFTTADGVIASGPLSWSGTGTLGNTVELWANGEKIGETVIGEDGSWSFDGIGADLSLGENELTVQMFDANGNALGDSVTEALTLNAGSVVDNSVPESASVSSLTADGGPSAGEFTTADGGATARGPISWSGVGIPSSTVELWVNGEKIGETVVSDDGTWSFDSIGADLNLGHNELTVQMLDIDGNVIGDPVIKTLVLDSDSVVDNNDADTGSAIVTMKDPSTDDDGVSTLSGTAEPGSTVTIYLNGEPIGTVQADENGDWSLSGYLPAGDHTLQSIVLDEFGNLVGESDQAALSVTSNVAEGLTPPADAGLVSVVSSGQSESAADAAEGANEDGTFDDRYLSGSAAISMILDASWSMTLPTDSDEEADRLDVTDSNNRINIARSEMIDLVTNTIPEGTPVTLRSLGNKGGSLECVTALEYPLQPMDQAGIISALNNVTPGFNTNTPLAATLANVPQDLADAGDREKVVVLLTDGDERCGGNVEEAISNLTDAGINIKLNIIGFAINDDALREKLEGWATLGNGLYFDASDASELSLALSGSLASVYQLFDADGQNVATGLVGGDPVEVAPGIYKVRIFSVNGMSERTVFVAANSAIQLTTE